MFKIIAFFIIKLFAQLCVRVEILLTCGKHVHHRIISLRGETWAYKTCLTPPLFIEAPVPLYPKTGKWALIYVCAMGMDVASFYDFDIWYWNYSDSMVVFFPFYLLLLCNHVSRILFSSNLRFKIRNNNIWKRRIVNTIMNIRTNKPSDQWTFGWMNFRTTVLSDDRCAPVLWVAIHVISAIFYRGN